MHYDERLERDEPLAEPAWRAARRRAISSTSSTSIIGGASSSICRRTSASWRVNAGRSRDDSHTSMCAANVSRIASNVATRPTLTASRTDDKTVPSSGIASPVRKAQIRRRVVRPQSQRARSDVVQRRTHPMPPRQRPIYRLAAELAHPAVTFVDGRPIRAADELILRTLPPILPGQARALALSHTSRILALHAGNGRSALIATTTVPAVRVRGAMHRDPFPRTERRHPQPHTTGPTPLLGRPRL